MNRRLCPAVHLFLGLVVAAMMASPVGAEETANPDSQGNGNGEVADRAERIEKLREAIRREQAALADDRERQRAVRERLETVREDLERKRDELRELEQTTDEYAREGE